MSTVGVVQRHRTALVRRELSKPMATLVRHGLVRQGVGVLDYGCGRGDDVRALLRDAVDAIGWDPHFAPAAQLATTEIVNLGYVVNVIEDVAERHEALSRAWDLTGGVLAVSVMLHGQGSILGLRAFRDGHVTSKGTFQRYYAQAEARAVIEGVTGVRPVSVAPGMFYVFRRPEDEQDFLYEHRLGSGGRRAAARSHVGVRRPTAQRARSASLRERIATEIEAVVDFALGRGRLPHPDELGEATRIRLAEERVSPGRLLAEALDASSQDALASSAATRREDMLVHHALGILNGARSPAAMSLAMDRDVRAFFGSRRELSDAAMKYLLALSDAEAVEASCADVVRLGRGAWDEKRRLLVHVANLPGLPGPLRCYVGCATHLSGEPEGHPLIRLDPRRRRVKFFSLERERTRFPSVTSAIAVDLKRQDVTVSREAKRLVRKSRLYAKPSKGQLAAERKHAAVMGHGDDLVLEELEVGRDGSVGVWPRTG